MRVMDLGSLPSDLQPFDTEKLPIATEANFERHSISSAVAPLLAYSVWPDDDEARAGFLATFGALGISTLERHIAYDPSEDVEKQLSELLARHRAEKFDAFGGHQSAALQGGIPRLANNLEAAYHPFCLAGEVLVTLWRIAQHSELDIRGGPSIRKAKDALEYADIADRSKLEKAWSAFKPVAHLAAAHQILRRLVDEARSQIFKTPLVSIYENLTPDMLLIARYFQYFAENFQSAHKSRAGLFEDMWRLPVKVPLERDLLGGGALRADITTHLLKDWKTR